MSTVDLAAERGAAERLAVNWNRRWHIMHGNKMQREAQLPVQLLVAARACFEKRTSGASGGGNGLFAIRSPLPQSLFPMCTDHWLPLGRLSSAQREARIRDLLSNKFYVVDVGGDGERESVIFEGSEISWDQLRQQVTFVPRAPHTYIVMTPESDLMNNMNDLAWDNQVLCSIANEEEAKTEYYRRAAALNHAKFVEEAIRMPGTQCWHDSRTGCSFCA